MSEVSLVDGHIDNTMTDKEIIKVREILNAIKSEAIKEFADKAIERVEKARQKYQRLCKEQGEKMEEHMHIHFNGIIGIIKNLVKEMTESKE